MELTAQQTSMVNKYVNYHYGYLASEIKQDMYQEGYLGVLEGLSKFDHKRKGHLETWLYFYMKHRVADCVRKFHRQQKQQQEYQQVFDITQDFAGPDGQLQQALSTLPARQRRLLEGYYYQGYALEQVAKLCRLSRSECSRQMKKARQSLKLQLVS